MCFGTAMSLAVGAADFALAAHMLRGRRLAMATLIANIGAVELIEAYQYHLLREGRGQCGASDATMFVLLQFLVAQPILFLAVGEESSGLSSWWRRQVKTRAFTWIVLALYSLVGLTADLSTALVESCSLPLICDTFTGVTIGALGHVAWHAVLPEAWNIMWPLYCVGLIAMALSGGWPAAVLMAGAGILPTFLWGGHTGPAVWCFLGGAVYAAEFISVLVSHVTAKYR